MTTDLERAVHAYTEYLDEMLPTVTADDALVGHFRSRRTETSSGRWYRRPVAVFLAAMVAVLLIALLPVALLNGQTADVVEQPTTSTPLQPTTPTPLAGLEGPVQVDTSGGVTWAWEYDGNRVWRYADGRWVELPAVPGNVFDLAGVVSIVGTPWALTDGGIRVLDGDTWQEPDIPATVQVWRIAADPSSETLWLSTGERLYRWSGEAMIEIGEPEINKGNEESPDWSYVGEIAVTSDGTVWAAGLYGYAPMLGVLASYEPTTETWEAVKPWKGKPVPAGLLATTSSGGLWVLLEDWDVEESNGTTSEGWVLAYRSGNTGQWSLHDEGLPDGRPFAIAAEGDGIWLAQGYTLAEGSEPMLGLYHFDGLVWTRYEDDVEVLDVAVAPDRTVWYMADQEPYVLRPLER